MDSGYGHCVKKMTCQSFPFKGREEISRLRYRRAPRTSQNPTTLCSRRARCSFPFKGKAGMGVGVTFTALIEVANHSSPRRPLPLKSREMAMV